MKNRSPGKAVAAWAPVDDTVMLVSQMWNHASTMKREITARKGWSKLSGRDLQDLTAYFQSVQKLSGNTRISVPDPAEGRVVVGLQCGKCHAGSESLAVMVRNKTLMDIGAAMWNHVPRVETVPVISLDDMRKVVAYVWEIQYRGPAGIASRGEVTFMDKGCISCHRTPTPKETPQSPKAGKTFTASSMVALGWGSGREMHRQMLEKGITWPQLSPEDISNLVAFMNTLNR
jgi:mono/diheme cytochrome c family protein